MSSADESKSAQNATLHDCLEITTLRQHVPEVDIMLECGQFSNGDESEGFTPNGDIFFLGAFWIAGGSGIGGSSVAAVATRAQARAQRW